MTAALPSGHPPSPSDPSPLTAAETAALQRHEAVIARGREYVIAVGEALQAILDGRLYRSAYPTFADYCQQRWGWSRVRAHQLIAAAEVDEITVNHGLQPPQNERQARELARLKDPEAIGEVWTAIVEEHGDDVTAADVRAAVDAHQRTRRVERVQGDEYRMPAPAEDLDPDGEGVSDDADEHAERLRRQEEEWRQRCVAIGLETDDGQAGPLALYENLVSYARPCLSVKDLDQLATYLLVRGQIDEKRDFHQQLRDWLIDVDEALSAAVQHAHDEGALP